jgi:hypothetical protein
MEKEMGDFFKGTIDKVDILLRTIAPGFIVLLAIFLADSDDKVGLKGLFVTNVWQGIGLAIILGFLSYAFHAAILEDIFLSWAVIPIFKLFHWKEFGFKLFNKWQILHGNKRFPYFENSPLNEESKWQVVSALSHERWFRKASSNPQVLKMQEQLDKAFAWLIFLYCSSYLLICAPFLYFLYINKNIPNFGFVYFAGTVSLLCAVAQDIRVTRHELWLCNYYPQFSKIDLYAYNKE